MASDRNDDDTREAREALERNNRRPREHAAAFDWHDKQRKELGVVETFLALENCPELHEYREFSVPDSDPPDALIYDSRGEEFAVEIVELVNETAIAQQIGLRRNAEAGNPTDFDAARKYSTEAERWSQPDYFWERVDHWVSTKDAKCDRLFSDGKTVILLMHTDEMYLDQNLESHLALRDVEPNRFHEIWLVRSEIPEMKGDPITRLK